MNLIFLYGPPAAGKLTVATEVAQMTGYKLVDNHKALDYLIELFPRSNPAYDQVRSDLGRNMRVDMFAAAAQAGVDLITTFAPISAGTQDFMRQVRSAVESTGGRVLFVHLLPSREVLLDRVRSESRKGKKIDTNQRWEEVVGSNPEAFLTFPDVSHLVLDNSDISPVEAAEQIKEYYHL